MKHLLNNMTESEKSAIREQHAGGMKVMTKKFSKLLNSKLGDSKPFVAEQVEEVKKTEKKLEGVITSVFDKDLTPYGGWESPQTYRNLIKKHGEILFDFVDWDDVEEREESRDTGNYMWYSDCLRPDLEEPLDHYGVFECPVVTIPQDIYNKFNNYFDNEWKSYFFKWFKKHTGIKVFIVDTLK